MVWNGLFMLVFQFSHSVINLRILFVIRIYWSQIRELVSFGSNNWWPTPPSFSHTRSQEHLFGCNLALYNHLFRQIEKSQSRNEQQAMISLSNAVQFSGLVPDKSQHHFFFSINGLMLTIIRYMEWVDNSFFLPIQQILL